MERYAQDVRSSQVDLPECFSKKLRDFAPPTLANNPLLRRASLIGISLGIMTGAPKTIGIDQQPIQAAQKITPRLAIVKPELKSHKTPWRHIVIHHSAGERGNVAIFDEDHRRKGRDSCAYHFVITNGKGGPDGKVFQTSRWKAQKHGAHAGNPKGSIFKLGEANERNEFGIGICLVGNFDKAPPTKKQRKSVIKLVKDLSGEFSIPASQITGHNDIKATNCPGQFFVWDKIKREMKLAERHASILPLKTTQDRCQWCDEVGVTDKIETYLAVRRNKTLQKKALTSKAELIQEKV